MSAIKQVMLDEMLQLNGKKNINKVNFLGFVSLSSQGKFKLVNRPGVAGAVLQPPP